MEDLTKREYASWLEEFLQSISMENPSSIAVVMRCEDGYVQTGYWGCSIEEKALFATRIQSDCVMGLALANADRIVEAAREMEEDQEEDAE